MGTSASQTDKDATRSLRSSDPYASTLGKDAPVVRCYFQGSSEHNGQRRVALSKDLLMVGRSLGEPEESLVLKNAEVVVDGSSVIVTATHAPPLTMWLRDTAEAEEWAVDLRDAAQLADRVHVRSSAQVSQMHRAHSERVAQLEARVTATLHAAVQRTQRINELEPLANENKRKDEQIKALEQRVEETTKEHMRKAERVRELETVLENGPQPDAGSASSIELDAAMQFASQLLGDRRDLMLDDETVVSLQEAVSEVQRVKPAVTEPVAEMVKGLVDALRWPVVLRNKLVDAESTIKEQQMLQDKTLGEMRELRKQREQDTLELNEARENVTSLQKQLTVAEESAKEAAKRLQNLYEDYQKAVENSANNAELNELKEQRVLEVAKRSEAQAMLSDLQKKLAEAEKAAAEAREQSQQLMLVNSSKDEDVIKLRDQLEDIEARRVAAEQAAQQVREQLVASEQAYGESVSRQQVANAAHEEEIRKAQQRLEAAEASRDEAHAAGAKLQQELKERFAAMENDSGNHSVSEHSALQEAHEVEIRRLREQSDINERERINAETKIKELRQRLIEVEQASEEALASQRKALLDKHEEDVAAWKEKHAAEKQSKTAIESKYAEAERRVIQIKEQSENLQRAAEEASRLQADQLHITHTKEIEELQTRCWTAEKNRAKIEKRLLMAEAAAGDAAGQLQDAQRRDEEVQKLREEQAEHETKRQEMEKHISDLKLRLKRMEREAEDAEEAAHRGVVAPKPNGAPPASAKEFALPFPPRLDFRSTPRRQEVEDDIADSSSVTTCGKETASEATLAHWLEAADHAAQKLSKDRAAKQELQNSTSVPKVRATKIELEERLIAAENAVGKINPIKRIPSELATSAESTPVSQPRVLAATPAVGSAARTGSSGGSHTLPVRMPSGASQTGPGTRIGSAAAAPIGTRSYIQPVRPGAGARAPGQPGTAFQPQPRR